MEGDGSKLGLVTKLTHAETGEWQESLIVMPLSKTDPQGYGSALTYARRYGLSALVEIVTEDDDGNSACKGVPHGSPNNGYSELEMPKISTIKPRQNAVVENLPHIDGINYQQQKS